MWRGCRSCRLSCLTFGRGAAAVLHVGTDLILSVRPYPTTGAKPFHQSAVVSRQDAKAVLADLLGPHELFDFGKEIVLHRHALYTLSRAIQYPPKRAHENSRLGVGSAHERGLENPAFKGH